MKPFLVRGTVLAVLLSLSGCAAAISREELLKEMEGEHAPLIIDVRSLSEYDRDHVPGAVHIPFTRIASGLASRNTRKDERLVIYCEHGPRAVMAYWSLSLAGYGNISSLDGHMKKWRASLYPIETILRSEQ